MNQKLGQIWEMFLAVFLFYLDYLEKEQTLNPTYFVQYWWEVSSISWIKNLCLQTCSEGCIDSLKSQSSFLDYLIKSSPFPVNMDMIQSKICLTRLHIPFSRNHESRLTTIPETRSEHHNLFWGRGKKNHYLPWYTLLKNFRMILCFFFFFTCIRNVNLGLQQSFKPMHSDTPERLFSELKSWKCLENGKNLQSSASYSMSPYHVALWLNSNQEQIFSLDTVKEVISSTNSPVMFS